jgi:hypothetical protein
MATPTPPTQHEAPPPALTYTSKISPQGETPSIAAYGKAKANKTPSKQRARGRPYSAKQARSPLPPTIDLPLLTLPPPAHKSEMPLLFNFIQSLPPFEAFSPHLPPLFEHPLIHGLPPIAPYLAYEPMRFLQHPLFTPPIPHIPQMHPLYGNYTHKLTMLSDDAEKSLEERAHATRAAFDDLVPIDLETFKDNGEVLPWFPAAGDTQYRGM